MKRIYMEVDGKFKKTDMFMPPHDLREGTLNEHKYLEKLGKDYGTCFSCQEEELTTWEKIKKAVKR